MDYLDLKMVGGVLALIGALLYWVRRRQETRALPPPTRPVAPSAAAALTSSEATESTSPSSEAAKTGARYGTPRERRMREIEEREQTGMCLYCERQATRQVPQIKLVLPWIDRVYRRMNRVPNNEWVLEVHPDVSVPHLLCDQHQQIARSHAEGIIADEQSVYAKFVDGRRRAMYIFTNHELDERMLADANEIRKGTAR